MPDVFSMHLASRQRRAAAVGSSPADGEDVSPPTGDVAGVQVYARDTAFEACTDRERQHCFE